MTLREDLGSFQIFKKGSQRGGGEKNQLNGNLTKEKKFPTPLGKKINEKNTQFFITLKEKKEGKLIPSTNTQECS